MAIVRFTNTRNIGLSFSLGWPDRRAHLLLPGESLEFTEVVMSDKAITEEMKKRNERMEYKREKSRQSMRELREARKLGVDVTEYRKSKGE